MNFEVLDDFNGLEMGFISNNSGGYISKNKYLLKNRIDSFKSIYFRTICFWNTYI